MESCPCTELYIWSFTLIQLYCLYTLYLGTSAYLKKFYIPRKNNVLYNMILNNVKFLDNLQTTTNFKSYFSVIKESMLLKWFTWIVNMFLRLFLFICLTVYQILMDYLMPNWIHLFDGNYNYIFCVPLQSIFKWYFYLTIIIIWLQLYGIKYSYLILIIYKQLYCYE